MYFVRYIQNPVYYRKFGHNQAYSTPIQTYSIILWYIYNPGQIIQIHNPAIFKTLAHLEPKLYSKFCLGILCYNQNVVQGLHIENPAMLRMLAYLRPRAYSEPCLFKYIQAYSITTVVITLSSFFVTLILLTFQRN